MTHACEDILIVGNGVRTTPQGIDFIVDRFCKAHPSGKLHVLVQQLPSEPESFIHLDMVFTLLNHDMDCLILVCLLDKRSEYHALIPIKKGKHHIEMDERLRLRQESFMYWCSSFRRSLSRSSISIWCLPFLIGISA